MCIVIFVVGLSFSRSYPHEFLKKSTHFEESNIHLNTFLKRLSNIDHNIRIKRDSVNEYFSNYSINFYVAYPKKDWKDYFIKKNIVSLLLMTFTLLLCLFIARKITSKLKGNWIDKNNEIR